MNISRSRQRFNSTGDNMFSSIGDNRFSIIEDNIGSSDLRLRYRD